MLQLVLKMVDTSLATRFKISINKFYIVQPPLLVAISTHDVLQKFSRSLGCDYA